MELKGVVDKVQALVKQSSHSSWAVVAVVWTEHGGDEILWKVSGVGRDTLDGAVRATLVDDVSAMVRGGLLKDS